MQSKCSFVPLIVFVRFSSSQARFLLAELVRRHSVGHIMLVLILSVYVLICAAPVTHPLSHASSQDGARVWYSAHFCYVHTVHRGETCLASIRQVCVACPTVRGVSLHMRVVFVAASSADRRNSVTKQCRGWHPSRPPGALLDAVHIAGCFKFLTLEELSCVIFHRKLVLSSDWSTVRVLFVISGMFSST